jgi:1-acyl-sn-glycerol-3-phosphate acyltransferase
MIKGFRFQKNDRGYSDFAFRFLRNSLIPATRYVYNPRVTNPHNMPQTGPCFLFGNHSNYFDPFMMNVPLTQEPTAGVMTRDQFHKVLPRIFMDGIGIVPTSKYVPEPGIIRSVMRMIDQRRMIVIFPEGGRRWDGRPKPLIETTLKLFWKMKIPVHPVQLHGSYLGWPRWADHHRKSSVEMRFLDPLNASDFDDYETFADRCRQAMEFDEYNPPEHAKPISGKKPASGIERFLYRCPKTGVSRAVFTPDGEHVYCRTSDMHYTMNLNSRLIDRHGEPVSILDLYDAIRNIPMVFEKPDDRILLEKPGSTIYRVDEEHQLQTLGRGFAELTNEQIRVAVNADKFEFTMDEINYISIEQNHKLTVTTSNHTLQIDLEGYNALQWQHYINRLKTGEKPVHSL